MNPFLLPKPVLTDAEKAALEDLWAAYEAQGERTQRDYWHREHGARHCYCGRRISAQIDVCRWCEAEQQQGEKA